MCPCSVTPRSVTPALFHAVRRLPALRGLASALACLMALPLCLPFAQIARADTSPAHSSLATVLQLQQMEKQAKAHPAPLVSSPASRLANTPYAAPRVSAPALVPASVAATPASSRPALPPPLSVTLLNEVGKLPRPIPAATVTAWKQELHTARPAARRAALLHLWLGEWELAQNEQPHSSSPHLRAAQHLAGLHSPISGVAAFDAATTLFYEGAYGEAADAFARLLSSKTAQLGYGRTDCALWLRHARACVGFHEERSRAGIPEPPRLDPNCGAAALAASLKGIGLPSDFKTVRAACRVTGFGSSLDDVIKAGPKLGVSVRTLTATDAGLIVLPKPLVSFVEGDHFIAVVRADKNGVSYLCSDCGPWPGGRVNLTWKQWHLLEPGIYAAVTKPGTVWDQRLAAQGTLSPAEQVAGKSLPLRLAMNGPIGHYLALLPRLTSIRGVTIKQFATRSITCGYSNRFSPHCGVNVCCLKDSGGAGAGGGAGGGPSLKAHAVGASTGDPVNLATGEEEYTPPTDLSVYNPHGPSVEWGRIYNSLRSTAESLDGHSLYYYLSTDYGDGWSHPYNTLLIGGGGGTYGYLIEPNGAFTAFTQPANAPTAAQPSVPCAVQAGYPALISWNYDGSANGHYTVTWPDRTRWIMAISPGGGNHESTTGPTYQLSQIGDRNGNHIDFHYVMTNAGSYAAQQSLLSTITSQDGTTLLAIQRDGKGGIASVTDCYGREVFYHVDDYGENIFRALDFVSQVVPTGMANAPARYVYGYESHANIEGYHPSPFLHTISVPSPTGSGTSTATINYDPNTLFVSSLVDANGNTRTYKAVDYLHTKVTVTDAQGHVAYSYVGGFDNNMSRTSVTDGAGHLTSFETYGDPNDPYRPSSVTDGNASQSFPNQHVVPGGTLTIAATGTENPSSGNSWDVISPTGTVVASSTSPAGWNVTLASYIGAQMPPPKMTVPTGTPIGAGYKFRSGNYRPAASALFDVVNLSAGYGTTAYTWDSYGNMVTETSPRGTVTTKTWDYSQFALGELKQVIEGDKTPTSYAYYEPSGLMKTLTTPAPGTTASGTVSTSWTYDSLGNVLTVTAPGNNAASAITTTFGYTQDGGYSQTAAIGQPLTVTDNLGKVSHFRYDSRGNLLSVADAISSWFPDQYDFTYNIADQPLQTICPAANQQGSGRTTQTSAYLYPGGPLTGVTTTDETGAAIRQVSYAYGQEGETLGVSGSTEPVTYAYDAQYRLSVLTDGNGHATHYYYKQQGELDAVTYPGYAGPAPVYNATTDDYSNITGVDSLRCPAYDVNGNMLRRIDGNGVETDYTHNADPESLLTNIHYVYPQGYTGGTTGDVSLAYDAYGRRAGMTDGTGNQSFAYDDLDDPLSVTTTYTGLAAKTVSYRYYPNGSRQSMTTPVSAIAYNYTYDAVGRMTGMTNPYGQSAAWSYLDNGWANQRTLSNAGSPVTVTSHYYDQRGELTGLRNRSASNATLSDYAGPVSGMAYDGAGNRTAWVSNVPAMSSYSRTVRYAYDVKNQVTQEASSAFNYTNPFGYDGSGNITSFKGQAHTYNADNQDAANTYDGNGNPTVYSASVYSGQSVTFDPENRLTRWGSVLACGYNGDGQRAWKQNSSGGRTYFVYDGSQPVCEMNSSGSLTAVNDFGADGVWARHTTTTDWFYTFDPQGCLSQKIGRDGSVLCSSIIRCAGA